MKSLSTTYPQSGFLPTGSSLQIDLAEAYSAPEQIACHCYGASELEIKQIISDEHLSSVEELTELTGYGGACRACGNCLKRMVDEHRETTGQEAHPRPMAGSCPGRSPLLAQQSPTQPTPPQGGRAALP